MITWHFGRFLSALLLLSLLAGAQSKNSSVKPPAKGAAQVLNQLIDAEWEYGLQQSPTGASQFGDYRWNTRWDDFSFSAIQAREAHARQVLKKLSAIDRKRLARPDRINYDLFCRQISEQLEAYGFKDYLAPLNQLGGLQNNITVADELATNLRFANLKDYDDWIARLNAFPAYLAQIQLLMRKGMEANILQPRVVMERVTGQIDRQLVAPEESGFYAPFRKFAPGISEPDQARLRAAARAAIGQKIIPAWKDFRKFYVEQYLPASYEKVGIWQRPNGAAYYAYTSRVYTTTDLKPEEIHQKGLSEVARIRAEMEAIKSKAGFKGTLAEFFTFLRTDPQFYFKTGDELLAASRANAKTIDPKLVKLFKTLPRMPYGVSPIPMVIAPDTTTAYYSQPAPDGSRAGTYFVNVYKLETRPKWEMMALSLHESVPGHHLQIALSMELGKIPNFRRYGYYSAFGEGWGLYAESLGDEMGLYDDPYSKFGQLTYEMWRAVRLVVDTGIHHKQWSREQAIKYFMENAAKNELDVTNEVDRYIVWPGQALSYKIGQLKIRELRALAEKELGAKFDVREFHDVVLLSGALPLDVLENNIHEWLAEKRSAPAAKKKSAD